MCLIALLVTVIGNQEPNVTVEWVAPLILGGGVPIVQISARRQAFLTYIFVFSIVRLGKCSHNTLNWITTVSYHILSNYSPFLPNYVI